MGDGMREPRMSTAVCGLDVGQTLLIVHSSVDGHSGCFRVLAIGNCAAVNTGAHASSSFLVSSGYLPSSGIPGS